MRDLRKGPWPLVGRWPEKLAIPRPQKASARLAAAQTRKAHLVNVILPAAYHDLGDGASTPPLSFRDEFPEQYAEIAEVDSGESNS